MVVEGTFVLSSGVAHCGDGAVRQKGHRPVVKSAQEAFRFHYEAMAAFIDLRFTGEPGVGNSSSNVPIHPCGCATLQRPPVSGSCP